MLGADLHLGDLDRDAATVGHRVARIDDEVHDHLLDLRAIGLHADVAVSARVLEHDVLADHAPQ